MIFGVGFLVLGVLNVLFGIGTVARCSWARPLGVILQGLNLLFSGVDWIQHGFGVTSLLSVVVAVVVLRYLSQPTIREAFGRNTDPFGRRSDARTKAENFETVSTSGARNASIVGVSSKAD